MCHLEYGLYELLRNHHVVDKLRKFATNWLPVKQENFENFMKTLLIILLKLQAKSQIAGGYLSVMPEEH